MASKVVGQNRKSDSGKTAKNKIKISMLKHVTHHDFAVRKVIILISTD